MFLAIGAGGLGVIIGSALMVLWLGWSAVRLNKNAQVIVEQIDRTITMVDYTAAEAQRSLDVVEEQIIEAVSDEHDVREVRDTSVAS